MNIVVLDGYTLNPGDLCWENFKKLGNCQIYDRTTSDQVVERARSAEILIINKIILNASVLEQLPNVRYIGVLATGYNVVDIESARRRNIMVTNIPAYGTRSVAQMTFALMLELALNVGVHSQSTREGEWSSCTDFCYWKKPLLELEGLTLGIVGLGRIGQSVAQIALAMGMRVMATCSHSRPCSMSGVIEVELDALFQESDIVSLHCPLTPETRGIVSAHRIGLMKKTAFLINTSRGPLIDEVSLAQALQQGCIAGAGLDVLSVEPPPVDHPLLRAPNCLVTPHIAWATQSARRRLLEVATANVQAFLRGQPQNVVS